MSAGDREVPGVSSRSDLNRVLTPLASRIEILETEFEKERSRRKQLEEQDKRYELILEDILALEDAVKDPERVNPDSEPSDDALPIMRLTWSYRAAPDRLQADEKRPAVVWSNFFEACSKTPTKYVLDSTKVGTILTGDEES